MPRLRLEEFELTITDIEDKIDKLGKRYLKAKGYHRYDGLTTQGTHYKAYDIFSSIQLYGSNQLLDETIRRFTSIRALPRKMIIDVLDCDLILQLKEQKILAMLVVVFYDFKFMRIGTRKLIKRLQRGEIKQ